MAAVTPKFNYDFTVRELPCPPQPPAACPCSANKNLVANGRGSCPSLAARCAFRVGFLPSRCSGQDGAAFCNAGEWGRESADAQIIEGNESAVG